MWASTVTTKVATIRLLALLALLLACCCHHHAFASPADGTKYSKHGFPQQKKTQQQQQQQQASQQHAGQQQQQVVVPPSFVLTVRRADVSGGIFPSASLQVIANSLPFANTSGPASMDLEAEVSPAMLARMEEEGEGQTGSLPLLVNATTRSANGRVTRMMTGMRSSIGGSGSSRNAAAGGGQQRHTSGPLPKYGPAGGYNNGGTAGTAAETVFSVWALNAFENRYASGGNQFQAEPPDQGLCVGNGFVVESVNDAIRVYSSETGAPLTPPVALNAFYGYAPAVIRPNGPDSPGGPPFGPSLTDPSCVYDARTRRFIHVVLTLQTDALTGDLLGPNSLDIAVSRSANPRGGWYVYRIPAQNDGSNGMPNHGCTSRFCLGDYPQIAVDDNGLYITTNEFALFDIGFFGVNVYAISTAALAAGAPNIQVINFFLNDVITLPAFTLKPAKLPADRFSNYNNNKDDDGYHSYTRHDHNDYSAGSGSQQQQRDRQQHDDKRGEVDSYDEHHYGQHYCDGCDEPESPRYHSSKHEQEQEQEADCKQQARPGYSRHCSSSSSNSKPQDRSDAVKAYDGGKGSSNAATSDGGGIAYFVSSLAVFSATGNSSDLILWELRGTDSLRSTDSWITALKPRPGSQRDTPNAATATYSTDSDSSSGGGGSSRHAGGHDSDVGSSQGLVLVGTLVPLGMQYTTPSGLANQKPGPIPLGQLMNATQVGGLDPSDSRVLSLMLSAGRLWGALATDALVAGQRRKAGLLFRVDPTPCPKASSTKQPSGRGGDASATTKATACTPKGPAAAVATLLAVPGAHVLFPAVAVNSQGDGLGVVGFTLTGDNDWPSAAYATLTSSSRCSRTEEGDSRDDRDERPAGSDAGRKSGGGYRNPYERGEWSGDCGNCGCKGGCCCRGVGFDVGRVVVANRGRGPQDGFSEYEGRPRWGDYGEGAVDERGDLYVANEFIAQRCTLAQYLASGLTCGNTRASVTNWATAITKVTYTTRTRYNGGGGNEHDGYSRDGDYGDRHNGGDEHKDGGRYAKPH